LENDIYRRDKSLSFEVLIVNLGLSEPAPRSFEWCHKLFYNLGWWDYVVFFTAAGEWSK